MDDHEAALVALSLSPAIKAAVLAIDVTEHRPWWWRSRSKSPPSAQCLNAAAKAGLVEKMAEDFAWLYRLTPSGLKVRAALEQP